MKKILKHILFLVRNYNHTTIDCDNNDEDNYSVTQSTAIIQLDEYKYLKIEISHDQDSLNW